MGETLEYIEANAENEEGTDFFDYELATEEELVERRDERRRREWQKCHTGRN